MSDLNTRIENAKTQVTQLKKKIEETQASKNDQSLGSGARANSYTPAPTRGPPQVKPRRTLKGHFGKITALHWGGDSKSLVSASQDGNLLIWNAVTSNKIQSITLKSSYVMSVGMEQTTNNLVACGGLDNLCTVYRRDDPAGNATEMASHDGFLSCCRFLSPQSILTASGDSTCILWDIPKATPVQTFAEHSADAMFISIKDANTFVSCSVDQTAKVWDIRAPANSVMTYGGHTGDINAVEVMPKDGNCFATCSQDATVRVFDMRACNMLHAFGGVASVGEGESFTSLTFSGSGRLIFCGHADGNVYGFDVLGEKNTPSITYTSCHDRNVSCVGVSPAGNALCTGSWDYFLKIWA